MRITFLQTDILWEQKTANLAFYEKQLAELSGQTDLVVLTEMCTTGFSMHSEALGETNDGDSIRNFLRMSAQYGMAIAGTHIGKEGSANYFNRAFFIQPDGKVAFYDKKHLFRMGDEPTNFSAGNHKTMVSYLGWNIRLSTCYDLRFPIWLRNVDNEYDLLLVMSNWPESRQHVFSSLLIARAIENQAFVCGTNRIGTDGNGLYYAGGSMLVDAYGNTLNSVTLNEQSIQTTNLDLEKLQSFRAKFPVWKDADRFKIIS